MTECSICFDPYNGIRKKVACFKCDFEGCRKCIQRYILESGSDVACMNCKIPWERDFLNQNFTKTFITKDLKEAREAILLDREKSLLPETQAEAENIRRGRNERKLLHALNDERKELMKQVRELDRKINDEYRRINLLLTGVDPETEGKKITFNKKCPSDTCRGFLSNRWKCGSCDVWVCPECHEIKGTEQDSPHTCNPETVATVQLLKNDSKPCPNCTAMIYKIEGCNHMFCTECKTAFDWRTGQIHKNGNTNPHYHAWRRSRDDVIPESELNACAIDGDTQYQYERNILRHMHIKLGLGHTDPKYIALERLVQHTRHIRHYDLGRFPAMDLMNVNKDLRIRFLLNEITEGEWKFELQKREKDAKKKDDIRQIIELMLRASWDIFIRIPQTRSTAELDGLIVELENLRLYVNQQLKASSEKYNSKRIYFFTPNWQMLQLGSLANLNDEQRRYYGLDS